jgi:threonine dehydrogenase-like Zn-dependent dehydrogenase
MGHEFTGEVVALGEGLNPNAAGLRPGDIVAVNPLIACGRCRDCLRGLPQYCPYREIVGIHRPGSFAEYVAVPVDRCHKVTSALAGALVEPLACSVRAAAQAHVGLGDSVVVLGAGVIGLFALKISQLRGARQLILIDINDHRLRLGHEFGATHTVNPRTVDALAKVLAITDGGADMVIDAVGLSITRQLGVDLLRSGGRMVWIGLHEDDTRVAGNVIVRKEVEVVGSFCYTEDDFRLAHMLVETGIVVPSDTWLDVRPMTFIKEAFDEQIEGSARFPKLVLAV